MGGCQRTLEGEAEQAQPENEEEEAAGSTEEGQGADHLLAEEQGGSQGGVGGGGVKGRLCSDLCLNIVYVPDKPGPSVLTTFSDMATKI